jgi:hypothetical protein
MILRLCALHAHDICLDAAARCHAVSAKRHSELHCTTALDVPHAARGYQTYPQSEVDIWAEYAGDHGVIELLYVRCHHMCELPQICHHIRSQSFVSICGLAQPKEDDASSQRRLDIRESIHCLSDLLNYVVACVIAMKERLPRPLLSQQHAERLIEGQPADDQQPASSCMGSG